MKQVLLAINGETPSKMVFQYAVDLSKRIRADLSILQFIKKDKLKQRFLSTQKKVKSLSRLLEDSFAGVAFAEEGRYFDADEILSGVSDPLKAMVADTSADLTCKLAFSNGDPDTNLTRFVESHHDIVLAIFDLAENKKNPPEQSKTRIEMLKKHLGVPLVVVNPEKSVQGKQ